MGTVSKKVNREREWDSRKIEKWGETQLRKVGIEGNGGLGIGGGEREA